MEIRALVIINIESTAPRQLRSFRAERRPAQTTGQAKASSGDHQPTPAKRQPTLMIGWLN